MFDGLSYRFDCGGQRFDNLARLLPGIHCVIDDSQHVDAVQVKCVCFDGTMYDQVAVRFVAVDR
jgi:hypothetical protein